MAFVRVEQTKRAPGRHRSGSIIVKGRDGKVAKAMLTAISNTRRGGRDREEEATAIQWTLWGKQAENAAEYLGKGSHVNIVGRLQQQQLPRRRRRGRLRLTFTCEEIDYLDSKAESARRAAGEPRAPKRRPQPARAHEQAARASGKPPRRATADDTSRSEPARAGARPAPAVNPSRSKETS